MNEYIKALISLTLRKKKVLNHPISVIVDATTECNMSCKMCYRNEPFFKKPSKKFLTIEILQMVLSQIKPRILSFGGLIGEPLTNKDICDLVKIVVDNDCKAVFTTNGQLLTEDICSKLIDNGIHLIKISVDAATKETYKKIRQSNKFDRVINNIKRLGEIEETKRKQRQVIRLEYVIQNENIDEVVPFLYLANKLRISNITFLPMNFIPISKDTEISFKENFNLEKIMNMMKEAISVSSELQIQTNLSFLFRKSHKMKNLKDYILKDSDLFYFPWYKYSQGKHILCAMPWIELVLDLNGDVSICCVPFTPGRNEKGLIIGNFNENKLSDIWNGEKAQRIRQMCATKENYNAFTLCRLCVNRPNIWGEIQKNKILSFV